MTFPPSPPISHVTSPPPFQALLSSTWLEVTRDSKSKFHECLRPPAGQRHFVSAGSGLEASVEEWVEGGAAVLPTSDFSMTQDLRKVRTRFTSFLSSFLPHRAKN